MQTHRNKDMNIINLLEELKIDGVLDIDSAIDAINDGDFLSTINVGIEVVEEADDLLSEMKKVYEGAIDNAKINAVEVTGADYFDAYASNAMDVEISNDFAAGMYLAYVKMKEDDKEFFPEGWV